MTKGISFFFTLAFLLYFSTAFGRTDSALPPDTTTNIVDKTAATYILEEGKTLFGEGKVKAAMIKFRQAGIKDPNSWRAAFWISQCHYKLNNYGYALQYGKKAVELGGEKVNNEVYFVLAKAYHRMGEIDSALVNYQLSKDLLSSIRSNVLMIDLHIQECEFAKVELAKEPAYTKTPLVGDINSGYDDYSPIVLDGGKTIYFTSRRSNTTGGGLNPDDQTYFEDVYISKWDSIMQEWSDVSNDLGKINSEGFDALNYISPDKLYGVMTLNTTATDSKKVTRGSDLCELKMNNKGTWNSPKIINNKSINTSFFEGAATLTADGNTMYFVSDRKGDKSSTDIYVVQKNGKSWGTAKPLPMTINTASRETTPYITPDGRYLFFSSDGHAGLGGYDVYVVENLGDSWGTPINLGYGINSVNDDTHFVYLEELKKGFISGFEIIGNKASIDIYEIDLSNFKLPTK